MPKVRVAIYARPDDEEIEVTGLGLFVNHTETEVSDEQVLIWENHAHGMKFPDNGVLVVSDNPEQVTMLERNAPVEEAPQVTLVSVPLGDDEGEDN